MTRGCVAAAVVMVGVATRSASASPVRLETVGGTCDLAPLEARVTQLAGHDPFDAGAAAVVSITTTSDDSAVIARIVFDDGNGRRRGPRIVRAKTCDELVEATAMVVTMALPELKAEAEDMPHGDPPTVPVATSPKPSLVDSPEASPPSRDAHPPHATDPPTTEPVVRDALVRSAIPASPTDRGGVVTALLLGGAGVTTTAEVQEQVIAGLRWRWAARSLTAELRADAPDDVAVGVKAHVHVFRSEASLSPCLHLGAIAGCLVASIGTIHGSGTGLSGGRSAFTPMVSGGLRVTWEHPLSARLALRMHADVTGLATRTEFDVDHMQVWSSQPFEGSVGIGILARFP